jgi:hypothetical protein
MSIDIDAILTRALSLGMLTDMKALRERVLGGEWISSSWLLLTALIKGEDNVKERILNAVGKEHFSHMADMQDDIFEWITHSLRSRGSVDIVELYQNMEAYVRDQVLLEHKDILNQILTVGTPGVEEVNRVLAALKQQKSSYADLPSERIILAALIKGSFETRKRVLNTIDSDKDIRSLTHSDIFGWIMELLQMKGRANEMEVYQAMERYVFNRLAPVYIGHIDHLLAIDIPDTELIDKAIANLKRRYAQRRPTHEKKGESAD